jgi:hypothetical protein
VSDIGNVETSLAGLDRDEQRIFKSIFQYILGDMRFGRAEDSTVAKNFGAVFYSGTTHATPGTEFSIPHGFGRPPYLLIPVLPLDAVNATLVPLTVTRAADSSRIYLSSSVASAPFVVFIEG